MQHPDCPKKRAVAKLRSTAWSFFHDVGRHKVDNEVKRWQGEYCLEGYDSHIIISSTPGIGDVNVKCLDGSVGTRYRTPNTCIVRSAIVLYNCENGCYAEKNCKIEKEAVFQESGI